MRIGSARAFVLAAAAVVSCGKGSGATTADSGLHGPTDVVVTWTLTGKQVDASGCQALGATQIYVNLSGTIDPDLHQSTTVDCATGTVTFSQLLVEKLGTPYVEGTLLDAKGVTVVDGSGAPAITGVDVTPALGTTSVTLDFFPASTSSSSSSSSSSSTSSTSSSSTSSSGAGGTGGMPTSSGSGGMGGAPSSSSSSGSMDAGTD